MATTATITVTPTTITATPSTTTTPTEVKGNMKLSFYAVVLPSILVCGWIMPSVHFFVATCMLACGYHSLARFGGSRLQPKKGDGATPIRSESTSKTTETKATEKTTAATPTTSTSDNESTSAQPQSQRQGSPRGHQHNKPCMACNTPFECRVFGYSNSIITCQSCHEVSCGKCFSNKCDRTVNPFERCSGAVMAAKATKPQRTSSRKLKELFTRSKK